jgi:RNA dependent RNA polymerase
VFCLAGAKGMWIVDITEEKLESRPMGNICESQNDPAVWIEITDEQTKFESTCIRPLATNGLLDFSLLVFEVLAYAKPLKPASLNMQILTVLLSQGVSLRVIHRLLMEEITGKAERMKHAITDPRKLAALVQTSASIRGSRLAAKGIEMAGGLPYSQVDRLLWLLNSGFTSENKLLLDLCREQLKRQHSRLVEKMNINIKRSTHGFIVPDPMYCLPPTLRAFTNTTLGMSLARMSVSFASQARFQKHRILCFMVSTYL